VPFAGRRRQGCKTSARCRAARWSWAYGVSADGSVVVGVGSQTPHGRFVPFAGRLLVGCKTSARCRAALGARLIGVSADGSRGGRRGLKTPQGSRRAFRWTASGWMQDLGTLGGSESWASGVSADGWVVVGWAQNAAGQTGVPFAGRRRSGMEDLGTLPGDMIAERGLLPFPPTASWWSAGLTTCRKGLLACLSLDGFCWDARPRHAAGRL
jgi:uncharacterized membrane protein